MQDTENATLKVSRKSTRNRKSPVRYPEKESNNIYVNFCRVDTPCTFEEAMDRKDREKQIKAVDNEIESLIESKNWVLVNKRKDKEILELKWVYSRKSNDVFKARLLVRGFQQSNVIDDIYGQIYVFFSWCVPAFCPLSL